MSFRFIKKWRDDAGVLRCRYEAEFWEGPTRAGEPGRRVRRTCEDALVGKRLLNTAPSVSYHAELMRAIG